MYVFLTGCLNKKIMWTKNKKNNLIWNKSTIPAIFQCILLIFEGKMCQYRSVADVLE